MYLVFTDLGTSSVHALGYAACVAQRSGHEIILFHQMIIDDSLEEDVDSFIERKRKNEARRELERLSHFANPKQDLKFHFEVHDEIGESELSSLIKDNNVTLAFAGISSSAKLKKWLFGSHSADFIELGICNFLIVPEKAHFGIPDNILYLTTGTECTNHVYEVLSENKLINPDKKINGIILSHKEFRKATETTNSAFSFSTRDCKDIFHEIQKVIEENKPQLVCVVAGVRSERGCFENSLVQKLSLNITVPLLVVLEQ